MPRQLKSCLGTLFSILSKGWRQAIPSAAFSGTAGGHLRAYAAKDGKIILDFDTAAETYEAVNGLKAKGGTLDGAGPVVVNGVLYMNSGYGRLIGQPGNVLLAFTVDGR